MVVQIHSAAPIVIMNYEAALAALLFCCLFLRLLCFKRFFLEYSENICEGIAAGKCVRVKTEPSV